jgi:uncharacterized protein (TIGR02453 family)
LFRINRDIRFSPNKNPYKTNLGLYFPYSHSINQINKDYNLGLYFHFESDASFIAIGMHNPDSTNLKLIRKKIAESYHDYESIINNNEFKQVFTDNYSTNNLLTRVAGYDKNHPAIEYLKQKEFTYGAKISDDVFFDGTLLENIINTARVGVDYCEYIFEAIN